MIQGVIFTDSAMTTSAVKCVDSMKKNSVEKVFAYMPEHIDPVFRIQFESTLNESRGVGFWLWKPYIIDRTLKDLQNGDYLIYSDAGVEFLDNVKYIIDRMDQDIFLFGNKWDHKNFCKMDAAMRINRKMTETKQCQASVIFIKVSDFSRMFIQHWLGWCCIKHLIDDSPSVAPNVPTFVEHRHDQSLLTEMAIYYDIKRHWWPASYNNGAFIYDKEFYPDEGYPVLFLHHRRRNNEY